MPSRRTCFSFISYTTLAIAFFPKLQFSFRTSKRVNHSEIGTLGVVPGNSECRPQNTWKWIQLPLRALLIMQIWAGIIFPLNINPGLHFENWYRNGYRILIELDVPRPRSTHCLNAVLRPFGKFIHSLCSRMLFTPTEFYTPMRMRTQLSGSFNNNSVNTGRKIWISFVIFPGDFFPTLILRGLVAVFIWLQLLQQNWNEFVSSDLLSEDERKNARRNYRRRFSHEHIFPSLFRL